MLRLKKMGFTRKKMWALPEEKTKTVHNRKKTLQPPKQVSGDEQQEVFY
jgi:hypothetical protein